MKRNETPLQQTPSNTKRKKEFSSPVFEEEFSTFQTDGYDYGNLKRKLRPWIEVEESVSYVPVWAYFTSAFGSIPNNSQTTPTWAWGIGSATWIVWTNSFVIPSTWTYLVTATVRWNAATWGVRQLLIMKNSTFVTAWVQPNNGWANDEYCNASVIYPFTVGDVVRCDVFQNSGTSVSVLSASKFGISKIS